MGRSESDRKKKKRRSRSRSLSSETSYSSHRSSKKKSGKKSKHRRRSRSKSRSSERSYKPSRNRRSRSTSKDRSRRSRSSSYPRDRRSRSRSRGRDRYERDRRSRERSPERRRRSRSLSRDRRRSRSGSRSRSRRGRSTSLERGSKKQSRSGRSSPGSPRRRSHSPVASKMTKEDPCANIEGFELLTPPEKAAIRMKMALKAAAEADAKLKEQGVLAKSESAPQLSLLSLEDQLKRQAAINDIEGAGFVQSTFTSSRGQVSLQAQAETTNGEDFLTVTKKNIIHTDGDSLMHPNFYEAQEDKMERWYQKLMEFRRSRIEGEVME